MAKVKQSLPYDPEFLDESQAILDEPDRTKKWRMVAELLRKTNPAAKKEQDYQIKAMADVRRLGLYKKEKSKKMGLRFAVSIPPMTFNAMSVVDPSLRNIDKSEYMTKDATNKLVKELEDTFPEYRAT